MIDFIYFTRYIVKSISMLHTLMLRNNVLQVIYNLDGFSKQSYYFSITYIQNRHFYLFHQKMNPFMDGYRSLVRIIQLYKCYWGVAVDYQEMPT